MDGGKPARFSGLDHDSKLREHSSLCVPLQSVLRCLLYRLLQLTYTSIASRPEAMAISAISYLSEQMQWEFFVIRGRWAVNNASIEVLNIVRCFVFIFCCKATCCSIEFDFPPPLPDLASLQMALGEPKL